MSRVLVLAGGSPHAHDFVALGDALVDVTGAAGHDVTRCSDPDDGARLLDDGRFDVLVLHGLWWRMLDQAYDAWRDDYAYTTPEATRRALAEFVRNGGGMVALHTAPVCFDDWPEWGEVLGASWNWGVSGHPPYGPVQARVIADHPVVDGLAATIALDDEIYGGLDMHTVYVLATARRTPDDTDQPVIWAHRYGEGRVVFDGFGHNAASISHTDNARVIRQAIDWVAS